MTLSELIRYYRASEHLSLEAIGDYVGVAKSTVKRWESGESKNIPQAKLEKLSELFGINVEACLNNQIKPILGYVKAGYDLFAQENLLGYEEVTRKEARQGDYYLKVQGDSMNGSRIYDGDLVYVQSCSTVESGRIAVVMIGDEATIKKVYFKNELMILEAANPKYESKFFTMQEVEEIPVKVIGLVRFVRTDFV